jgi:hypothetical protein
MAALPDALPSQSNQRSARRAPVRTIRGVRLQHRSEGANLCRRPETSCSENSVPKRFKIGDHVSWNSEAGRVSGTIIAVHTRDFDYKGHVHHGTEDDPQYEIKSDKTDHIAAHKGGALRKT